MGEDISIRKLTGEDWQIFSALRLQALLECPDKFGSPLAVEEKYTPEEWQAWLNRETGAMFSLFDGQKMIGTTGIVTDWDAPSGAVMIASYILPEYRGRGLSYYFYQARIDWAKHYPAWTKITVGHREGNEASRRANQRHGFSYVRREPHNWPDGITADILWYELSLMPLRNDVVQNVKECRNDNI